MELRYPVFGKCFSEKDHRSVRKGEWIKESLEKVEMLKPIADKVTLYLRNLGFDVVDVGNYQNFNVKETLVIDRVGIKPDFSTQKNSRWPRKASAPRGPLRTLFWVLSAESQ